MRPLSRPVSPALTALLVASTLLATAAGAAGRALDEGPATRFALVVGANDGGADRVRLRYATVDAENFAQVMGTYGGIPQEQMLVVLDPDRDALDAAFAELHRRLGDAAGRTELVVFYSGHADEKGLLLGGQRLGYAELRRHISSVPADVRIAIVDACASGALIRSKGGTRRPPFLVDQSSRVTGHAYLASASADEAAQESDRLQASFFSHALLTGLRGAADVSADGVVTLGEAYQFAFRETLARTEGTRLGAQHASFDMQLVGSGDVVLTDLRQTGAGLLLADDLAGRVFVRDGDGRLIAELQKPAGQPVKLGLAPGSYRMRLETTDGRSLVGAVALLDGSTTRVDGQGLTVGAREETVGRGDDRGDAARPSRFERVVAALIDEEPPDGEDRRAIGASITPSLATDGGGKHREVSFNLLAGTSRSVGAVELGVGVNHVEESVHGVQLAAVANVVDGEVRGVQLAGVVNVADTVRGVQLAGAVNVAGAVDGVQLAPVAAVAGQVDGWQQAAVVSVAETVDGVQLGLVNHAGKVNGAQFGLINVADEVDGLSVALIPWIKDGRRHVELFSTELSLMNIGGRLGGGAFHTLLSGGYDPTGDRYVASVGFGAEIVGEVWSTDIDLVVSGVVEDEQWPEPDGLVSLRVLLGAQLFEHLGVFGGASWNVAAGPRKLDPGFEPMVQLNPDYTLYVDMWPGFIAGVRF